MLHCLISPARAAVFSLALIALVRSPCPPELEVRVSLAAPPPLASDRIVSSRDCSDRVRVKRVELGGGVEERGPYTALLVGEGVLKDGDNGFGLLDPSNKRSGGNV